MRGIQISPEAEDDLAEIWLNIAYDNALAADAFVERLTDRFKLLAQHPNIGTDISSVAPGLHRWPVDNYLIFYSFDDSGIRIEHVIHGARDWHGLLS